MTLEQMIREIVREEIAAAGSGPRVDLTLRQVGALLDRHEETIRLWCAGGKVPGAYQLMDREWRIPVDSVEALQEAERERWATRGEYAARGQG